MSGPTPFLLGRDINGYNGFGLIPCDYDHTWSVTLAENVSASITVPSDAPYWEAIFSIEPGTNVWVSFDGTTAAVPAGGSLVKSHSELNPNCRLVSKGSLISIITSSATAEVSIMLYSAPTN